MHYKPPRPDVPDGSFFLRRLVVSRTCCTLARAKMDQEEWQTQSGLSKADFEKFTQYMNSNNPLDNRNRAILLGFIEDGIKVRVILIVF
jgi:hypothetical protein